MKVLVADDDCTACLILRSIVKSCGMSCDIVHTGCDAVDAVANHDYCIVFLDLIMPVQNGDVAASQILSMKNDRAIPTLVGIISYEDDRRRKQCLASGMIDVIAKPICRE